MSYKNAVIVLPLVFDVLPPVDSVIDFGAGSGDWLKAAQELSGAATIKGYDITRPTILDKIPEELRYFVTVKEQPVSIDSIEVADLNKPLVCDQKYDLAIAVAVAEHLQPEASETFIETVTGASDFVLFSAAIPYQWGEGHINIRWHTYWSDLFTAKGYLCADCLRQRLWDYEEDELACGYKQNAMIFAKAERYGELKLPEYDYTKPLNLVHPYLYTNIHGETYSNASRNRKY